MQLKLEKKSRFRHYDKKAINDIFLRGVFLNKAISVLLVFSLFFFGWPSNNFFSFLIQKAYAAWDMAYEWDTGDINVRATTAAAVADFDGDGTAYVIAPIQHGVKAYDPDGNLEWSYSGIQRGYDVRDLAVGDLHGTGNLDSVVVVSGYYNSPASDGKVAILDKDGNETQVITVGDFASAYGATYSAAIDGTDIYLGTPNGITKFVKSGSTWSEDATNWNKSLGTVYTIRIADLGNGKRVIAAGRTSSKVHVYETDGTLEWETTVGSYFSFFRIGSVDSTKSGSQIVAQYQGGIKIYDKDGNAIGTITTPGTNVRVGVALYDSDSDGEQEIYYTSMDSNAYSLERTGVATYSTKYSLTGYVASGQYGGVTTFDINDDGDDEVFLYTKNGHVYIYDATLTTLLKDLDIGHGQLGGYLYDNLTNSSSGIIFYDTSGDGHEDLIISGSTGYVDVYESSGFGSSGSLSTDIVDSSGDPVSSPSMAMGAVTFSFPYQTATGSFSTSSEKIRVENTTSDPQWTLTLAGTDGPTDLWEAGSLKYDFNDPTSNATDGGDTDSYGGQMTVDASSSTLGGTCSATGMTKGSSASFSEGATDSITLLTAGSSADTGCYWDLTNIAVSQTIPSEQPANSYSISVTLTITAI